MCCWHISDGVGRDDMQPVLCRHLSVRVGDDELQPLPARYIPDRDRGSFSFKQRVLCRHLSVRFGYDELQPLPARHIPDWDQGSVYFKQPMCCRHLSDWVGRDDMQPVLCRYLSVRVGDDKLQPLPTRYIPDLDRGSVSFKQPVCCWHVSEQVRRDGMRCVLCRHLSVRIGDDKLQPLLARFLPDWCLAGWSCIGWLAGLHFLSCRNISDWQWSVELHVLPIRQVSDRPRYGVAGELQPLWRRNLHFSSWRRHQRRVHALQCRHVPDRSTHDQHCKVPGMCCRDLWDWHWSAISD